MYKRFLTFFLAFVLIVPLIPTSAYAVTQSEAVEWAMAHMGEKIGNGQCTSLTEKYAKELFDYELRANPLEYLSLTLPDTWETIKYEAGFLPLPGDIAVWEPGSSTFEWTDDETGRTSLITEWIDDTGHVAVIISATNTQIISAEMNWHKSGSEDSGVKLVKHRTYNHLLGVLRPPVDPDPAEDLPQIPLSDPDNAPSDWAAEEVSAAITLDLVPENLQRDYTQAVTRGNVARMFVNLIEKCSGTDIDTFLRQKKANIDPDAFTDTKDSAVLACHALGIISGVGGNRFAPDRVFTRSQIAAIINRLARVLGVDTDGYSHSFTDVKGHWADTELGWPVHADIIRGTGGGKFTPDGQLTAEQAIVITYRAWQYFC